MVEGDGQVEVCVHLISPEGDIDNRRVLVLVFIDPENNPDGIRVAASKLYVKYACMHTGICSGF